MKLNLFKFSRSRRAGRAFLIETSFYFHCINCCLSFSLISGLPFGLVLCESDMPVPPSFQGCRPSEHSDRTLDLIKSWTQDSADYQTSRYYYCCNVADPSRTSWWQRGCWRCRSDWSSIQGERERERNIREERSRYLNYGSRVGSPICSFMF